MKNAIRLGFLCATAIGISGLADTQGRKPALDFSTLKSLKPGVTKEADLVSLLGKPDRTEALTDRVESNGGKRWEYLKDDADRLTAFLGQGASVLTSFTFLVQGADPERTIGTAMGHFPGAKWQVDTVRWINPHHFPDTCFLKDDAEGVRIEYGIERLETISIRRWDPSRKIAAAPPDEKPPEYCLGNSCSPAMAAADFFKQWPVDEYCKVAKLPKWK